MIYALIPARHGSTRLPGKNTRELCCKPLWLWALHRSLECIPAERTVVTSDDPAVLHAAAKAHCIVRKRPPELCTAEASMASVVRDAFQVFPEAAGFVLQLPTSPFLHTDAVADAYAALATNSHALAVVSDPCGRFSGRVVGKHYYPEHDTRTRPRTQDINRWRECGALFAFTRDGFATEGLVGNQARAIPVTTVEAIDIDTQWDWRVAEALAALVPHDCEREMAA